MHEKERQTGALRFRMSAHRASNWGGASPSGHAVVTHPNSEQVAEDEHSRRQECVRWFAMLESSKLIGPQVVSMKSTVRQLAGELISASRGIGHAVGRAGSLQSDRFFDDNVHVARHRGPFCYRS
jgi:hypothetical protein